MESKLAKNSLNPYFLELRSYGLSEFLISDSANIPPTEKLDHKRK